MNALEFSVVGLVVANGMKLEARKCIDRLPSCLAYTKSSLNL